MSNWVEVKDRRYGDVLWVNVDNICYIHEASGNVLLNGVHGEGSGIIGFPPESIEKIKAALNPTPKEDI